MKRIKNKKDGQSETEVWMGDGELLFPPLR